MTIRDYLRDPHVALSGTALTISVFLLFMLTGCGLLGGEAPKSALEAIKDPAIDVLTKVIRDRHGSDTDKSSAYCEELPDGFQSGIEELDEDERRAFVICSVRASE